MNEQFREELRKCLKSKESAGKLWPMNQDTTSYTSTGLLTSRAISPKAERNLRAAMKRIEEDPDEDLGQHPRQTPRRDGGENPARRGKAQDGH